VACRLKLVALKQQQKHSHEYSLNFMAAANEAVQAFRNKDGA
jgi:hypothetical protein